MKSETKKLLINAVIALGVGLVLAFLVMLIGDIFNGEEVTRKICDGFFTSGTVMLCIALLMLLGKKGEYDSLSYIGYTINPFKKTRYRNYDCYKEAKEKKREEKPPSSNIHMFIAGGVLIVIAVIFLIIYKT